MLKKILFLSIAAISGACKAAAPVTFYRAPLSSLNTFPLQNSPSPKSALRGAIVPGNVLQTVTVTKQEKQSITRYQQFYKGIPVFGAQVTIIKSIKSNVSTSTKSFVSGNLINDIQLNTQPGISSQQALEFAKKIYFSENAHATIIDESSELQIRPLVDNALELVYVISFKTISSDNKPKWPVLILRAQNGELMTQWNNIKTFEDSGPGGNEKGQEYWYGKDGLPALEVIKNNDTCVMDSKKVRLVNVNRAWDWFNNIVHAYQYPCGNNNEDKINGAFSPINDAYYFGHTIVDMYQDWYGLNALQDADGKAMPLIMRVHFGQGYDNAFWDGETMSFGDGSIFYPLISLDVAGHEVTHGFTEQHSGLEYHDESGALNESLSDMAGMASRAYLLESKPELYNKVYLQPNEITWGIGETIVRDSFGKALRFMDNPSEDGRSADCLDKILAQKSGGKCTISYDELVRFANAEIADAEERQAYIVHTASGIFNKAFYLLSQKTGIKTAFNTMLLANINYWTPNTDFKTAACGVLYAANDLKLDIPMVKSVFEQVGVDTTACSI